nr:PREDICTED: uncharacterized protein LOC107077054 [Lepisosteus oculatus]
MQANGGGMSKRSHQKSLCAGQENSNFFHYPQRSNQKQEGEGPDWPAMHQKQMAEYTEELYASTSDLEPPHDDPVEMEPAFLDEEVVWALKKLPNNKAPGIDCIPAEMLRPVPPVAIKAICQKIWETNSRPKDWKRSVFISLPKKDDARDCCSYRTITLIPHASKVLLKIIQQGLCPIIEAELPDSQAVFKRGCGTSDHITNLRWIMEKCHEHQKNI